MSRDNYIMLVGHNYDEHRLDFAVYAKERARQAIDRTRKGRDVRVQIMDIGAGTTSSISVSWQNGLRTTKTTRPKTHEPVKAASYDRSGAFRPNQPRIMSITDLYAAVRSLGDAEPGTLVEVSIFSHAYYQGPILVNSDDNTPQNSEVRGARDPHDKDGRAAKDFYVMGESQLALFRGAFSPTGLAWIWGCNMKEGIHQLLSLIYRRQPKNIVRGTIELSGLSPKLIELIDQLNADLHVDIDELRRKHRCKFDASGLRSAIATEVRQSYTYKVSSVAKVRAIGALPATYAEKRSLADPRQLLEIAKHTRKHAAYYVKNFGIRFDDESRGYAVFEPSFVID